MRVLFCDQSMNGCAEIALDVADGATIADVLALARAQGGLISEEALPCGIWSRAKPLTWVVREGDRVERYRALLIDPKHARRSRGRRVRGQITG